jgi:choline-sulfatase
MSRSILGTAEKWIDQARNEKSPFFLFVNLLDAHLPYRPKKPYIHDFLRSLPREKVNLELTRKFVSDGIVSKKKADMLFAQLTAADWRWLERFYDSNIRAIDDQIGLFLRRLKSAGTLANTLVIITADHGELFGESGLGGHYQLSMQQPALHIPLIFWFPKRLAAGEMRQPVSQVDIFPNILKLAGLSGAIPRQVQGADLFAQFPDREILAEFWDETRLRFSRALVCGDFKLVVLASGKRELYDLSNDPREKSNLAAQRPDLLQSLLSRLDARLRSMPQKKSVANARKKKDMEKLLKSLGYL